eukprot:m51a1_g2806 hypothetical protein (324) ;mRNA; r:118514-119908
MKLRTGAPRRVGDFSRSTAGQQARPTSCLDVDSVAEGSLRLFMFTVLTIYVAFIGFYFIFNAADQTIWQNHPPIKDVDMRDMIDDYIATFRGISKKEMALDESAGYTIRRLSTQAALQLAQYASNLTDDEVRHASISVGAFPALPAARPLLLFRTRTDYDASPRVVRVSVVDSLRVVLALSIDGSYWRLQPLEPAYKQVGEGPTATDALAAAQLSTRTLAIAVADVSEPSPFQTTDVAVFRTSATSWVGVSFLVVLLLMLVAQSVVRYVVHRNVRVRRGLPPPRLEVLLFPAQALAAWRAQTRRAQQVQPEEKPSAEAAPGSR